MIKKEKISELLKSAHTIPKVYLIEWKKFRSMQACYSYELYDREIGEFQFFKSYNTIVGIWEKRTDTFYELNKWSTTTSKQVTTFIRTYEIKNRILIIDADISKYQ